jgi:serine/threonine protein kinase
MERFPLGSLTQYVQKYPSIPPECVFGIGWRLVKCLENMHDARGIGWLHLDIKPDNIMVTEDSKRGISLVDFGMTLPLPYIIHQPRTEATGSYACMGTHVWDVERESRRDDLESVGLTMAYLLLGGKLPWIDDTRDVMRTKIQATSLPKTLAKKCKQPMLESYLEYVRALGVVDEKPDYEKLLKMFEEPAGDCLEHLDLHTQEEGGTLPRKRLLHLAVEQLVVQQGVVFEE